jgi:hypothetical protein
MTNKEAVARDGVRDVIARYTVSLLISESWRFLDVCSADFVYVSSILRCKGKSGIEMVMRNYEIRIGRAPTHLALKDKNNLSCEGATSAQRCASIKTICKIENCDPQIAGRFEQLELPVWTESQELRRFIAGYLALLPIKRSPAAIDKRFVEYLLELSEGVTGRIIDILRRAALQGIADETQRVGLVQLQVVGAKTPSVVGQRA